MQHIKSKEDYENKLLEAYKLLQKELRANSKDFKQLNALTSDIHKYEKKYFPVFVKKS